MVDDLTPPHWGDDFVEPKPGETFDLDRALSLAVCGYRVRAANMQPGAYVDYQFAGWRINFPGGSSSGWTPRDIDREAEWVEVPIEMPGVVSREQAEAKGKWGQPFKPTTPNVSDMLVLDPTTGAWVEAGTVPPGTYQAKVKDDWGKPKPPANVGNAAPARDSWGRPLPSPGKWGK